MGEPAGRSLLAVALLEGEASASASSASSTSEASSAASSSTAASSSAALVASAAGGAIVGELAGRATVAGALLEGVAGVGALSSSSAEAASAGAVLLHVLAPLAASRLVGKTFLLVELLLTDGEDEFGGAVAARESLVGEATGGFIVVGVRHLVWGFKRRSLLCQRRG